MTKNIRIRYRLTTLLAFMFFAAMSAAAYGYHLRALQREEIAFKKIAAMGGEIHVRIEGTSVSFDNRPRGFVCGNGLKQIIEPTAAFPPSALAPAEIAVLNDVRKLRSVDFGAAELSRSALEELRERHPKCKLYQNEQEI